MHRDFCEVAILDGEGGRARGRVASTPEQLQLFAQSLAPDDRVALEVTGNAWEIARIIEPHVAGVIVVNPGDTGIRQARAKTDRLDALVLARLLAAGTLDAVWMPDEPVRAMRRRLARRSQLVTARSRVKNAAEGYVESVRLACEEASADGGVAGFLSEALLGNQGAIVPPAGYLKAAFEAVSAAGGLCIADEVQVGYARTGETFWAFEHEDVIPDIVATAKATGNGHPIGVVVCRREIADALGRNASFFSSSGGGPVSCQIGLAVLDVNSRRASAGERVSDRHVSQAASRAARAPSSTDRRGARPWPLPRVDFVRDRGTRQPAGAETLEICERMRELGVIMQPTGDGLNVLKIKPPLCIDRNDADLFVAVLEQALEEQASVRDNLEAPAP